MNLACVVAVVSFSLGHREARVKERRRGAKKVFFLPFHTPRSFTRLCGFTKSKRLLRRL